MIINWRHVCLKEFKQGIFLFITMIMIAGVILLVMLKYVRVNIRHESECRNASIIIEFLILFPQLFMTMLEVEFCLS